MGDALKLHLGSAFNPAPGWTNIDVVPTFPGIDLLADVRSIPLPDGCAEQIYAGHLCEHIPLNDMQSTLGEWRRLLASGGTLMIVIPDIEKAVRMRVDWDLLDKICKNPWDPPDGHAWTATAGLMRLFLEQAGFHVEDVPMADVCKPEWPILSQVEWQSALRCT